VRIWDLNSEKRESFFTVSNILSARISPDGKNLFVCRTNGLERWPLTDEAITGGALAFGEIQKIPLPGDVGARNLAISADGSTAAVELSDNRFVVLDLRGEREPVLFPERWRGVNQKGAGSPTGAGRFAISPDGRWVCTGYWYGPKDLPRVWDARTGTVIAHPRMDTSLAAFSPDGKWLGLAGVNEFQIYSTTHGETNWSRAAKFKRDESSFTHGALAFLDNGEVAWTRTRQIVQLRSGLAEDKFLDLIAPVPQSVASVRVSSNGKVMVTGSARDIIQVWRLDRIRERLKEMNLDWAQSPPDTLAVAPAQPGFGSNTNTILIFGLAGFLIVALLSLLTLRRHRAAIDRYFDSEEKASARNRELEVAKAELMHSQKMQALGTLAAGIAHDFNNLLSVIRMSNKLVGREAKENKEIQEHVADIETAVLQGKGVVGSMLGYARSDEGEGQPTDLCAVVEEAVSLLSKEFLSGIALTMGLDRNVPRVGIGRGRLEQILLNLIVNASEAMLNKGRLRISVQTRRVLPPRNYVLRPDDAEQYVEMAVTDSGPGIPAEIQDRLFEPFFTTKRSGTKAGTGLGLSLVYSIAQQEKLGLSVESDLGKGATFTIVLPVKSGK
jgi:signal transduction histidine kinase